MKTNLETIRKRRGLTMYELAKAAGVSVATIHRIENGHNIRHNPATLRVIANALNCDVRDLTEPAVGV